MISVSRGDDVTRSSRMWFSLVLWFVAAGCDEVTNSPVAQNPPTPSPTSNNTTTIPQPAVQPKKKAKKVEEPPVDAKEELDLIARAYEASRGGGSGGGGGGRGLRSLGGGEKQAVQNVTAAIKASLEVGPTLVVWVIDRTPSCEAIVIDVTAAAKAYYDSSDVRELSKEANSPLLTAVVGFTDSAELLLDPPTGDCDQVKTAFDAIKTGTGGRERTFAALKLALEKYLPLRTEQRREVLLALVTDEAGEDANLADELAVTLRKSAIPLYVIGLAAPWGQMNSNEPNPKTVEAGKSDDSAPILGPESLHSERVDLAGWPSGAKFDFIDSGFGPFALERLCRASRGQFFALRSGANSGELEFDEKVVSKYAPDYVTETEYQKLLSENKARAALHEAAKLKTVVIEGSPGDRFPKAAEAEMSKKLSKAQQFAARNSPEVDQLYAILVRGEGDREKLKGLRWQAEYDFAMGRVLAAKVRLDGYNSMIAALKRGKTFANASSTTWKLDRADKFETESTLKRLGDRAKMYLERVVQQHPGTPWAKIAKEELLDSPLGWTWTEE